MDRERESHWQGEWRRRGLHHAKRVPGEPKFFAIVAYPGSSGFLHIGHLRGLVAADAIHRHQRMLGRRVFFPNGVHASGLPAVTFAQKVAERDRTTVEQLRMNHVPETTWPELEDPARAARFLGDCYLGVYRRLGVLVDERAHLTTIDPDYQSFIQWQFRRLNDAGALVQAPHFAAVCPVCGPVSVDPSETDLSSGGNAEWVDYALVPFRLDDGRILLAATLRPETIFGVTNLWISPSTPLTVWHFREQEFLVSPTAAAELTEQHGGRVGHSVAAEPLLGRMAVGPVWPKAVPILGSGLVEASRGTGVVMSVPAHAPADWVALEALPASERERLGPIPELLALPDATSLTPSERSLLAGSGPHAQRAARASGAHGPSDFRAIEEATERLYRLELVRGRMRPEYLDGAPVREARERAPSVAWGSEAPLNLQQFSEPVICRNGHAVQIRRVPDQWFLRYSDPEWKSATKELVARTTVVPAEYGAELPGILDWFDDRPCVRRGRWLGTPFPLDPSWVIEPIADSTLYPAYYVVKPFVADGRIPVASVTDALLDFVFLGRGDGEPTVPRALQEELRAEFDYWYPLDLNIGGKEHKRVHFPVFLFTHQKLLARERFPKGLFVHWWLVGPSGGKISKKEGGGKGGVPPIDSAFDSWGADAIRLFHLSAASPFQDVEWSPDLVDRARDRLDDVEHLWSTLSGPGSGGTSELDAWLLTSLSDAIDRVRSAFADLELRTVSEVVFVEMASLARRYQLRGGTPGPATEAFRSAWARLMSPVAPHLAEELGHGRFPGLVAEAPFPSPDEFARNPEAAAAETYLDRVESDLRDVARVGRPEGSGWEGVVFFVAEAWKAHVEAWVREVGLDAKGAIPLRAVMERAQQHPEVRPFLREIPAYLQKSAAELRGERSMPPKIDELNVLRSATAYLARRFSFATVEVVREAQGESLDPLNRRQRARPGRPAFYLMPGRTAAGASASARTGGSPGS